MAKSTLPKNPTQGSITLADGTGSPVSFTLDYDNGNYNLEGIKLTLNEAVTMERRGRFAGLGHGERIYPVVSFSCFVAQFTDASAGVVTDFILKANKYSANVSTLGAGHSYTSDVTFKMEATAVDGTDHTFTLHDVHWLAATLTEQYPANQLSVSGRVHGAITGDIACAQASV